MSPRACFKNAFCQMCVTVCGRFVPNEGRIAGYVTRIWRKYHAKWGVQLAGMIFETRPNMIKKEKMILAGVSGLGNETAEIWKRFMKLYKEVPITDKRSDDSYEVRIYDSETEKESVFVGCEINSDCDGYEIFQIPSSEYASFDVYVEEGYESENNAMEEWLASNEKGYVRNLLEGKLYCVEHYDARFDGSNDESIVEIWLPVKNTGDSQKS